MKTKRFLMTSLLVMGMIIAKAANGFPPELVLVSQPVLTYNANSVTIYYDVQNIGDYTYRGDLYIYLDPDNGYCYAREYMRVCPGKIRRIAVSIPAYRANPSWTYTVMPYYELDGELYSFTTFEYFEPVRFHWYGYHDEPWVVIHVGPRPRYYHRPGTYRYYYDGYYPMLPPPGGPGHPEPRPLNPVHHTYGYHHSYGGYPANYHPEHNVPEGYNSHSEATVVHPNGANTPGSMSSRSGNATPTPTPNPDNQGATVRPRPGGDTPGSTSSSGSSSSSSGRTGTTDSGRTGTTDSGRTGNDSGTVNRPSSENSGSGSGNSGRTGTTTNSGRTGNDSSNVSRPSSGNSGSGTGTSGRSGNSSSGSRSTRSSSGSSNTRSSGTSSSSSRSSSSSSSRGGRR